MTWVTNGIFEEQHFFSPLLLIMPQLDWAILAIAVGVLRLIFLFINGAWRPSAHFRMLGCLLAIFIWGTLLISSLNLVFMIPVTATYSMILALELTSLWFAAGDAKIADLLAKSEIGYGHK